MFWLLETGSCCTALAGLDLVISCLCLLSTGITGRYPPPHTSSVNVWGPFPYCWLLVLCMFQMMVHFPVCRVMLYPRVWLSFPLFKCLLFKRGHSYILSWFWTLLPCEGFLVFRTGPLSSVSELHCYDCIESRDLQIMKIHGPNSLLCNGYIDYVFSISNNDIYDD